MIGNSSQLVSRSAGPYSLIKWLHRLLGITLLIIWYIPIPTLFRRYHAPDTGYLLFLLGFSLVDIGIILFNLALWWRYRILLRGWQKTPILIICLVIPCIWIAVYEFILLRQPIDIMIIFCLAGFFCVLSAIRFII